jgi:hypothetical protein
VKATDLGSEWLPFAWLAVEQVSQVLLCSLEQQHQEQQQQQQQQDWS